MDEFTVPDTLVLKMIEYNGINRDTILYILYDKNIGRYVIRGSRKETCEINKCLTYSFECDKAKELVDFIKFVIDGENDVSYILYKYDNLSAISNDVTYEFLSEYDSVNNEIAGYDNNRLKRKDLLKNLRMLRNIFNYNN